MRVSFRRTGSPWRRYVAEPVTPAGTVLDMSVEIANVGLVIGRILPIPHPFACLGIEQDYVTDVAELLATLCCVVVSTLPAPANSLRKFSAPNTASSTSLR